MWRAPSLLIVALVSSGCLWVAPRPELRPGAFAERTVVLLVEGTPGLAFEGSYGTPAQSTSARGTVPAQFVSTLEQVSSWNEPVAYRIYPQGPGSPAVRITTTRAGVGAQLILHETHHRSQVMSMLKQMGVAAQNLDYSVLMFAREQEPA